LVHGHQRFGETHFFYTEDKGQQVPPQLNTNIELLGERQTDYLTHGVFVDNRHKAPHCSLHASEFKTNCPPTE
jgi:hypothetical protein